MSDLPDNGDVIEFGSVTEGSPAKVGVRYRVEKKPLDLEYLLIDVVSGHAFRFQPQQFSGSGWKLAPAAAGQEVEGKGAASADSQPTEGLLVAKPLSDLPFVEDSDEEEVDEEEEDPVTKTKTVVKKKVKKKR